MSEQKRAMNKQFPEVIKVRYYTDIKADPILVVTSLDRENDAIEYIKKDLFDRTVKGLIEGCIFSSEIVEQGTAAYCSGLSEEDNPYDSYEGQEPCINQAKYYKEWLYGYKTEKQLREVYKL